jgi:hypothetical protein
MCELFSSLSLFWWLRTPPFGFMLAFGMDPFTRTLVDHIPCEILHVHGGSRQTKMAGPTAGQFKGRHSVGTENGGEEGISFF